LQETENGPLRAQELYGHHLQCAGTLIPLMRGWDWLTAEQRDRIAGDMF
jgi:hypothetical protein